MSALAPAKPETDIANISELPKRKPGRPVGSRNKISREARELLATGGRKAVNSLIRLSAGDGASIRALLNIAAGRPIQIDGGEALIPSVGQILDAHRVIQAGQEMILARLVAELKGTEISGPDGERLVPQGSADIASILVSALTGGKGAAHVDDEPARPGVGPEDHVSEIPTPNAPPGTTDSVDAVVVPFRPDGALRLDLPIPRNGSPEHTAKPEPEPEASIEEVIALLRSKQESEAAERAPIIAEQIARISEPD